MNLSSPFKVAAIIAACTSLFACTTTTSQSFVRVDSSRVESSYIAVGADFSKYDRLTPRDMGIYFPSQAAPSPETQQRARDIFRKAFRAELTGYNIVENAKGPTTLLVQASLIDFTNAAPEDAMSVGRRMRDFATPGSIIFMMELRDSMTDEVLARAGDSAEIPTFSTSADVPTDWDAVEVSAERWARLFREFLDERLGK